MKLILKSTCEQVSGKIAETTFCFNKEQNKYQWRQDYEMNPAYIDVIEFNDYQTAKTLICNFADIAYAELFFNPDTNHFIRVVDPKRNDECYNFCRVVFLKE